MNIPDMLIGLIIIVFSAILHEVAHGFVADKLGDPTARLYGRLTLDPRKHIDPFMSILLPLALLLSGSPILFGAAKPVPIDPFNLKEGRKDVALVALAGPLTNVLFAVIAGIVLKIIFITGFTLYPEVLNILFMILLYNLSLAIFNLIPIPPLDGSKLFAMVLPEREAALYLSIGNLGPILLFILLLFPIGGFSLGSIVGTLIGFALRLFGLPM